MAKQKNWMGMEPVPGVSWGGMSAQAFDSANRTLGQKFGALGQLGSTIYSQPAQFADTISRNYGAYSAPYATANSALYGGMANLGRGFSELYGQGVGAAGAIGAAGANAMGSAAGNAAGAMGTGYGAIAGAQGSLGASNQSGLAGLYGNANNSLASIYGSGTSARSARDQSMAAGTAGITSSAANSLAGLRGSANSALSSIYGSAAGARSARDQSLVAGTAGISSAVANALASLYGGSGLSSIYGANAGRDSSLFNALASVSNSNAAARSGRDQALLSGLAGLSGAGTTAIGNLGSATAASLANQAIAAANGYGQMANANYNMMGQLGTALAGVAAAREAAGPQYAKLNFAAGALPSILDTARYGMQMGPYVAGNVNMPSSSYSVGDGGGGFFAGGPGGPVASGSWSGGGSNSGGGGSGRGQFYAPPAPGQTGAIPGIGGVPSGGLETAVQFANSVRDQMENPNAMANLYRKDFGAHLDATRAATMDPRFLNSVQGMVADGSRNMMTAGSGDYSSKEGFDALTGAYSAGAGNASTAAAVSPILQGITAGARTLQSVFDRGLGALSRYGNDSYDMSSALDRVDASTRAGTGEVRSVVDRGLGDLSMYGRDSYDMSSAMDRVDSSTRAGSTAMQSGAQSFRDGLGSLSDRVGGIAPGVLGSLSSGLGGVMDRAGSMISPMLSGGADALRGLTDNMRSANDRFASDIGSGMQAANDEVRGLFGDTLGRFGWGGRLGDMFDTSPAAAEQVDPLSGLNPYDRSYANSLATEVRRARARGDMAAAERALQEYRALTSPVL